ncbi:MAG TPA: glycine cleavage system protein GcvH [Steroidobacteraceae bacterium]|nr:glycine cleavage system protein GcvH [Steroidobacteraceae bacterium]
MSNTPNNLKYVKSHEWLRVESDGTVTVGITDHAQHALGDVVFVEAPEVGRDCKAGEACAVVESVKAASDIYSPISGTVIAANGDLTGAPELLNQAPYEGGWIFKLKPSNAADVGKLLDAKAYEEVLKSEA